MGDPITPFLLPALLESGEVAAGAGALGAAAGGAAAGGAAAGGLSAAALALLGTTAVTGAGVALAGGKPKSDPSLTAQQNAAEQNNIDALKVQTEGDTASLLARYGQRLAMANATGTAPVPGAVGGARG